MTGLLLEEKNKIKNILIIQTYASQNFILKWINNYQLIFQQVRSWKTLCHAPRAPETEELEGKETKKMCLELQCLKLIADSTVNTMGITKLT